MFSEAHPVIRRAIRFALLPHCFFNLVDWKECRKPKLAVALDLLYIFFVLRDYPDNYGPCRLWEKPRSEWAFYFGSNYNPYQRSRLRTRVQPFHLEVVLNNKEVCHHLCKAFEIPVPEVLCSLDPDEPLIAQQLRNLLQASGDDQVIVKPVNGHAGRGIALFRSGPDGLQIRRCDEWERVTEFQPPERSIVQRLVSQDPRLDEVAPNSINTLRLLTMLTRSDEVILLGASMRFGVGSAFVDNWSAGGVAVGVDSDDGRLLKMGYDKRGTQHLEHPVSGIQFSGFEIPNWSEAVRLGELVQRSFPFTKILGLDLAFTPNGVVLIELNSDADFVFQEQTSGPLLHSRETWKAFRDYALFYNEKQRTLFGKGNGD